MNEAFTIFTMDKVLLDILAPLLVQVGLMWEGDEITTAHEHFATSILRSRIGAVMHAYPYNGILHQQNMIGTNTSERDQWIEEKHMPNSCIVSSILLSLDRRFFFIEDV
jgi:hypothetical protein